jgi:proline utilization trans-activator
MEIENRRRVWWTCYTFDRLSSLKLGHPVTIRDEDIDCPMPTMNGLSDEERKEFADPEHMSVNVKLTRISGTILNLLYSAPGQKPESRFIKDVQTVFRDLDELQKNLPKHLRLDRTVSPPTFRTRNVASLCLHFNEVCYINACSLSS